MRNFLLFAVWLVCSASHAFSQFATVGIGTQGTIGLPTSDTVIVDNTYFFYVWVKNYGPDTIPSGSVLEVVTGLKNDTVTPFPIPIKSNYANLTSDLMSGDSISVPLGETYHTPVSSPPGPYRIGGNIVVIWPKAFSSSITVLTLDSLHDTLYVVSPNGIIEFNNGELVIVAPNPANAAFSIVYSGKEVFPEQVRIFDESGKEVMIANKTKTVSIAHLSNGIYFVEAKFNNNTTKTFKIIKQNN